MKPDSVAYHEAGHAVIAQKLGVRVHAASVAPTSKYRGAVIIQGLFQRVRNRGVGPNPPTRRTNNHHCTRRSRGPT